MAVMQRIRLFHLFLAVTVIAAYFSAEMGMVHAWLGYGVAVLIGIRLIWALSGAPQLGLERFYPSFKGLKLKGAVRHPAISRALLAGIALSLLGATVTGVLMDNGRALQPAAFSSASLANLGGEGENEGEDEGGENESGEIYEEAHELLANLVLLFVILHVVYLLSFKRPLARFMLFANKKA